MSTSEFDCICCALSYNSDTRIPLKLSECGHTMCRKCWVKRLGERKLDCGSCKVRVNTLNVDEIPRDYEMLDKIEPLEPYCLIHEDKVATYWDESYLYTYCEECYVKLKKPLDDNHFRLGQSLIGQRLATQYKNMTDTFFIVMWMSFWDQLTVNEKLKLYHFTNEYTANIPKCSTHTLKDARWYYTLGMKFVCLDCDEAEVRKSQVSELRENKFKEKFLHIHDDNAEFNYIAKRQIKFIIGNKDVSLLGPFIQKSLNYSQDYHKAILESRFLYLNCDVKVPITEDTICLHCLNNFNLADRVPLRLRCSSATHAICGSCYENSEDFIKCLQDDRKRKKEKICRSIIFMNPYTKKCRECNQNFFTKDLKIYKCCFHKNICHTCKNTTKELKCDICNTNFKKEGLDENLKLIETIKGGLYFCKNHHKVSEYLCTITWEPLCEQCPKNNVSRIMKIGSQ